MTQQRTFKYKRGDIQTIDIVPINIEVSIVLFLFVFVNVVMSATDGSTVVALRKNFHFCIFTAFTLSSAVVAVRTTYHFLDIYCFYIAICISIMH